MGYVVREVNLDDISAITRIYNQGIEDRVATLETQLRTDDERKQWLQNKDERHKVLVIEDNSKYVCGWASLNVFNSRCAYSGVVDFSIYIERSMRGKGLGKLLLNELIKVAKANGFHKMILSALSYNEAGKKLYKSVGFREVGTYEEQGILDGNMIDVTIMEKLLK
jgi:L-amino acid N-acyltransferase YncA